jgi:hypothetical protein
LYDESAADRQAYLDMLETVAKGKDSALYRFVWAEIGQQPQLQQALQITGNAPTAVAVSVSKHRAAQHAGTFDVAGLRKFLAGISSGRTATTKLASQTTFVIDEQAAWDGQNVERQEEEEFTLDDILSEDL